MSKTCNSPILLKNWREKVMIAKKYLRNYSEIILNSLDTYSIDTTLKVSDMLISDEVLLKIEEILKSNPTEQEFLKMLNKEFPTMK